MLLQIRFPEIISFILPNTDEVLQTHPFVTRKF